jgi:hypothetical protein
MTAATPTEIGARSEAAVASALIRAGKSVFLPVLGVNTRVDLIYAEEDRLLRVQCKTSRLVGDALTFATCSNTKNIPRVYVDEVDVFGVYSPARNLVYLVPAAGLPTRACQLRLAPTRNGQRKLVRWADDYVLGPP